MNLSSVRSSSIGRLVGHHWLTIAFVLGFITDLLLLDRVDDTVDNIILLFYVLLATVSLLLFYVAVAERAPAFMVRFLTKVTPVTMQYSFGGLLSGMLIFYGQSGDWIASAPFLLLIILVIGTNELVKKRSERLLYNVAVYFIGIFSFCVLLVPVWLGKTGDGIFYASGLLAVALTMFLIKVLKFIIPNFLTMQKRLLVFIVGALYMLFNGFYYFNIIPPIPLSLIDLDIYQEVVKNEVTGVYTITKVPTRWYEVLPGLKPVFSPVPGSGAFCFAKVFAPARIKTNIVNRWEYVDDAGNWVEHYRLRYPISGENSNGYRGFSQILNVSTGTWRCSVENERGQVLGRKVFTVNTGVLPQGLVTVTE